MSVRVAIEHPDDNIVTLSPKFLSESAGSVEVSGRGNRIHVEDPFLANVARFVLTGGATLIVRAQSNLNALQVHALSPGVTIEIDTWASFNGACEITAHEPSTIRIGSACLFGSGCRISSSDVHKVFDLETRERLNPAGNIEIGEHVWAATGVTIMRNAMIGRDSVVGAGSIVRGVFPPHVTLAGIPARVVRTGITWEM